MPTLDPTPMINGMRYQFADVEAEVAGWRTAGFRAINYNDDVRIGRAYGNSVKVVGTTGGQTQSEFGFEMYKEEFQDLVANLGPGYGRAYFDIHVNYALDDVVHQDDLLRCRILHVEDVHTEGEEPLRVRVTGFVQDIQRDGNSIMEDDAGASSLISGVVGLLA